jgi:hypothetical protein
MQQYGPSFRQAERHMAIERFAQKAAPLIAPHQGGQDDNNGSAPSRAGGPLTDFHMQTQRKQP